LRFGASAAIELVFSFVQGAVSTIRTTIFMIGLVFGATVKWSGQSRDAYGISFAAAVRALWPQTLFGLWVCGALFVIAPPVFWWSLPMTAGYLLAVPFAMVTASPGLGRWFRKVGLCAIPEDFAPPPEVAALQAAAGAER